VEERGEGADLVALHQQVQPMGRECPSSPLEAPAATWPADRGGGVGIITQGSPP